jgi:hypothetical protein
VYIANEATASDQSVWTWGSGLIGLLVLFAAVALLRTRRYPQPIYDFVLGMNRWMLWVAAYAGLMTDHYPPFRLDQGGDDPAASRLTVPPPSRQQYVPAPRVRRHGYNVRSSDGAANQLPLPQR